MKDLVTEFRALSKASDNALSTREKCRRIEQFIEPALQWYSLHLMSKVDLADAKRLLDHEDEIRGLWDCVSQAATADQIGVEILKLTGCVAMNGDIDRETFAHVLADDIEDAHPTLYALELASRMVRKEEKWLAVQVVLARLASAKRRSRRIDHLFKHDLESFRRAVEQHEATLQRRIEEKQDTASNLAQAKLERWEPVASFTDEDCRALDMTRSDIEQYYRVEREFEAEYGSTDDFGEALPQRKMN